MEGRRVVLHRPACQRPADGQGIQELRTGRGMDARKAGGQQRRFRLDHARFDFVDRPPPFILDDPGTVLMDYYAEGREPGVVIEPYSPKPTPPTEEASVESQG